MCRSARIWISSAVICFLAGVPSSTSLSFNFSTFPNDVFQSDILLQGDAFNRNNSIELTNSNYFSFSVGRASYKKELFLLWDAQTKQLSDFTTRFVFEIRPQTPTVCDGLAFFLSAPMYTIPKDSYAGSLGLFTFPQQLRPKSRENTTVAVEFDTFSNPDFNDPAGKHIGIDINSMNSTVTASWSNFTEYTIWTSWVTYNSTTYNFSVFLSSGDNQEFSDAVLILNYTIDLSTWLPEKVEIGFSAGTGISSEQNTILSWSFHSTLQPRKKFKIAVIVISIAGAVVLILVAALGSLWFLKRRLRMNGNDEDANWLMDEDMDNEFERGRGPKRFHYPKLARTTGDFFDEGKLGEGGFRSVYRGVLKEPNLEVAIKRVCKGSKQGRKKYMRRSRSLVGCATATWCSLLAGAMTARNFSSSTSWFPMAASIPTSMAAPR